MERMFQVQRGYLSFFEATFEIARQNVLRKKYCRFTHRTTRQAPEDQQQFVVFCRGAHLFDDQKHQQSPRRGLEGTHLPEISKSDGIINLATLPHVF